MTTSRNTKTGALAATAIAAALVVGCSGAPEPPPPPPERPAAPAATPPPPRGESPARPEGSSTRPGPAKPAKPTPPGRNPRASAAWRPPFPERTNLFEPPRNAGRFARAETESSAAVVLMGFADLGQPQVVLAINGVVRPMSDGDEHEGVTVISIDPPRAVLQRGRTRWVASIE